MTGKLASVEVGVSRDVGVPRPVDGDAVASIVA